MTQATSIRSAAAGTGRVLRPRKLLKLKHTSSTVTKRSNNLHLASLPDDVLILVFIHVDIDDILALRSTSKRFSAISRLRWIWADALKRHVIDQRLPVPALPSDIRSLSSKQLEARAVHALRFHQNWCSTDPQPTRRIEVNVERATATVEREDLDYGNDDPVYNIMFLPGYNGELVVTEAAGRVACWEVPLSGSNAFLLAERSVPPDHTLMKIMTNTDSANEAVLAVMYRPATADPTTVIELWGLDRFHGAFTVLRCENIANGSLSSISHLSGDWVFMGSPVAMWNWRRKGQNFILNHSNHNNTRALYPIAMRRIRNHLLIVRQNHIQLLPLPRLDGTVYKKRDYGGGTIHLPAPICDAVIVTKPLTGDERDLWQFDPTTVLVRMYHQEVDSIYKYDLFPVPVDAPAPPSGYQDVPFPKSLPCSLPSGPSEIVPVVQSCKKLTAGPNGKGYWFENRNVRRGRNTFHARCFVGFELRTRFVPSSTTPLDLGAGCWKQEMVVMKKEVYASRVGMGEILGIRYRILSSALEDTVGRLAIGRRDGRIEIVDFA